VSTMTPPPDQTVPPAPPERRCPRCGTALAADQEWCLACGAAADTEVAEPRGWRVPIMLTGGLGLLALLGIVLLIIALAGGSEKLATATPTPAAAAPPAATATSAVPTLSPVPTTTPGPTATPGATATVSPTTSASSSFPGWTGGDGWTIIIESATTQAKAESVATAAQSAGESPGILKSDDFSSLNAGYWVVFEGDYSSKSEAQSSLDSVRANHHDAYVRKIEQ
jgi:predicted nucleic acid-binding Zn ribbon protein